jgi:hypothetical protein
VLLPQQQKTDISSFSLKTDRKFEYTERFAPFEVRFALRNHDDVHPISASSTPPVMPPPQPPHMCLLEEIHGGKFLPVHNNEICMLTHIHGRLQHNKIDSL